MRTTTTMNPSDPTRRAPWRRYLPLAVVVIHRRKHGQARGVVAAHGGHRVGHPDALDSPGIIGRERLALYHRHMGHPEHLTGDGRSTADDFAQGRTFAHLVQQVDGPLCIAECLHLELGALGFLALDQAHHVRLGLPQPGRLLRPNGGLDLLPLAPVGFHALPALGQHSVHGLG
jgi:hypothetical protein